MKLTNEEIFITGRKVSEAFSDADRLPVRANFFLQKNIKTLRELMLEIERERITIGKKYGVFDPDTESYQIPEENREEVRREMDALYDIEQEVEIRTVSIADFGECNLTTGQMEAILFMVEG